MNNYVPFLKLKVNEIGALSVLDNDIQGWLVPFFDLPKQKDGITPENFMELTNKAVRSVNKNLKKLNTFFLDNFDIDDSIAINGKNNYAFIIECFKDLNFIPVVGLDRTNDRNEVVFQYKASGEIKSNTVAIRLLAEDFLSFELVRKEIDVLIKNGTGLFDNWVLVIDNRVCLNIDVAERANQIIQFVEESSTVINFYSIIVTGSSVPSSIAEILDVQSEKSYVRKEIEIYGRIYRNITKNNLFLGDYTIISPLYSEYIIPPEAMRNVTAPKIFYSYNNFHFVARGGALKTHVRGDLQYNDISKVLINKPFYRTPEYSFGDKFLYQKAHHEGNGVTPSSILKPTINAHMTYMIRDLQM